MNNKMKAASIILLASGSSLLLGGCATVVNGTSQDYAVKSEPPGARAIFSNGAECVTPCELSLKRKDDYRVDFSKPGYQPASVYVESRTGGATFGNILAGGLIGAVVDSSNGSNNFLYPRPLSVRMVPGGSTQEAELLDKDGKAIASIDAHNAEVKPKINLLADAPVSSEAEAEVEAKTETEAADEAAIADDGLDPNGGGTAEGVEDMAQASEAVVN